MIKLELTVREAMYLATNWAYNNDADLYHKIVNALELAMGVNTRCKVTVTNFNIDNRISAIKAIRLWTGWGLKEAKDWTDVLYGGWDDGGRRLKGASSHSLMLKTPEAAEGLLRDLAALGCEGFLS